MKRRFALQAACAAIAASGLMSLPALAADTIKVGILHSLSGTMAISRYAPYLWGCLGSGFFGMFFLDVIYFNRDSVGDFVP